MARALFILLLPLALVLPHSNAGVQQPPAPAANDAWLAVPRLVLGGTPSFPIHARLDIPYVISGGQLEGEWDVTARDRFIGI